MTLYSCPHYFSCLTLSYQGGVMIIIAAKLPANTKTPDQTDSLYSNVIIMPSNQSK